MICKSKMSKSTSKKNQLEEGEDIPDVNGRIKTRRARNNPIIKAIIGKEKFLDKEK